MTMSNDVKYCQINVRACQASLLPCLQFPPTPSTKDRAKAKRNSLSFLLPLSLHKGNVHHIYHHPSCPKLLHFVPTNLATKLADSLRIQAAIPVDPPYSSSSARHHSHALQRVLQDRVGGAPGAKRSSLHWRRPQVRSSERSSSVLFGRCHKPFIMMGPGCRPCSRMVIFLLDDCYRFLRADPWLL